MKGAQVLRMALRALLGVAILVAVASLAPVVMFLLYGPQLPGGIWGKHTREHSRFASQFRAGDPNAPLLAMDWASGHGVFFCRVSQSGRVYSALDVGHATRGGTGISSRFSPDNTNRALLEAAINALGPSSRKSLPKERRILISGVRSNQWFSSVYDRANVPPEVETLYELTQAYLRWYIPKVPGRAAGRLHGANFIGEFVAAASEADLAVSFGHWVTDGRYEHAPIMEFWTLKHGLRHASPPFKGISEVHPTYQGVAVSPDGTAVAVANFYGLYVVDVRASKLLWQAGPLDHDHFHGTAVAIGGKGRILYTAGAQIIERWDLLSGRKLGSLGTNELFVKFLEVSQDGSTLLAGFGDLKTDATSFAIWESGKDEPALQFSDPYGPSVGLSPDGQTLVLCAWPEKKLDLWEWRSGRRTRIPLRLPYGAGSADPLGWSPDGQRLVAVVDTYPSSIVVYETKTWKPIAQWCCGQIGHSSRFVVNQDGRLIQLLGDQINYLDLAALKRSAD